MLVADDGTEHVQGQHAGEDGGALTHRAGNERAEQENRQHGGAPESRCSDTGDELIYPGGDSASVVGSEWGGVRGRGT